MRQTKKDRASTSAGNGGAKLLSPLAKLSGKKKDAEGILTEVDERHMMAFVEAAIASGALVSFSRTSDGGAVRIYVKDDTYEEKFYASNADELQAHLEALADAYDVLLK